MNLPRKIANLRDRQAWIAKHAPALAGRGISMSDAARKYRMTQPSISNMARRKHVRVIGRDPKDPRLILVDEGDIAYCAAVRRALGAVPGQKIFNADGSLYIPPKFRQ